MSVFCPKCGKRTYNEYKCDHCQYDIKPRDYIGLKKETIKINKNTILVSAVVVIAVSVAYLGISKYRENRATEEFLENTFGTSDPEKIVKKSVDDAKKALSNLSTIKVPEIKIQESHYEKERKLKQEREKQIMIQRQINIDKKQKESEKAKEELKKQMAL